MAAFPFQSTKSGATHHHKESLHGTLPESVIVTRLKCEVSEDCDWGCFQAWSLRPFLSIGLRTKTEGAKRVCRIYSAVPVPLRSYTYARSTCADKLPSSSSTGNFRGGRDKGARFPQSIIDIFLSADSKSSREVLTDAVRDGYGAGKLGRDCGVRPGRRRCAA